MYQLAMRCIKHDCLAEIWKSGWWFVGNKFVKCFQEKRRCKDRLKVFLFNMGSIKEQQQAIS